MADFTDAPASITYSVIGPKGFPALVSLRDETYKGLQEKMEFMETYFVDHKYTPQVRQGFKKEIKYVEGKKCPKCGGRLIEKISSQNKPYHKCENGKYDFTTKQNTGCDYVDWLDGNKETIDY